MVENNKNYYAHICKDGVLGIGTIPISPDAQVVRIDSYYLSKALKMMDLMNSYTVDMHLGRDQILVLGTVNEKGDKISGILIAPKVNK